MEAKANVILRAITELDKLFHAANERFFESRLPVPAITIQNKGRKNAAGWHWENAWRDSDGKRITEINVSAEYLSRGLDDIAGTMLHEMAHLWNSMNKVEDVSSNQYHNRFFARAAKRAGLDVKQEGNRGFARTSLLPETKEWLADLVLDADAFKVSRINMTGRGGTNKMRKWSCDCGINVRCAVELKAVCQICGTRFRLQD